jgi:hypothetical protein
VRRSTERIGMAVGDGGGDRIKVGPVTLLDFNKHKAAKLHEQAQRLHDAGNFDEAIAKYREAIALAPEESESYYNLGLIYKYRGEWRKSFECNQKANELDWDNEAARWNLAIAATALRNWEVARQKWEESGIALEGSDGPITMNLGMTPVRLNPDESGEVVWATRIDPARARLDNIPFPESRFRYGDIVLNDGAPVGYRKNGGREYPVFNVLALFEPSPFATRVATVSVESEADLEMLKRAFSTTRSHFEDWTRNTRALCKACSEGRPHEQHDRAPKDEGVAERRLGIAVYPGDDIDQVLTQWQKETRGRVLAFDPELPR